MQAEEGDLTGVRRGLSRHAKLFSSQTRDTSIPGRER